MKRNLKRFFNPKSIALIGASKDPNKVGGILLKKLLKFRGKVIPINPKYYHLGELRTYPSVLEYPSKIDLAIIAIPAEFVNESLIECAKKGIKNIIIISAGFSEIKENNLEKLMIQTIKKYNLNVLGPNCFGIYNPNLQLDTTFSNITPKKGDIAFISQSGALWSYIADLKIGFSGYVSLGNMADLSFTEWLEYFINDRHTKKIIMYIEKIKDGKKFIELCKNSKKEIIVLKAGQTKQGQQAALSHTASLATEYEIYKGAFAQAKIKVVDSLSKAVGTHSEEIKLKKKQKVIIITNAGGAGAILSDKITKSGQNLIMPPIDILGTANENDYENALKSIKNKSAKIIVILTPQSMSNPLATAKVLINSKHKKNIIALFLGDKSIKQAKNLLEKNKIPVYTNI
jgi:acetyltransferase